jgi:hypothetical protein
MRVQMIAGNVPSTWAVHVKTPFHLADFAGPSGAAATLSLAGPYWVGGAHVASRKANRSNSRPMRIEITPASPTGKGNIAVP